MEKEFDLLILTGENNPIAIRGPKGKQYKMPILAYIIKDSSKLVDDIAKLSWGEELEVQFDKKTIYRIKCTANVGLGNYSNPKKFTLIEILGKGIENEQLNAVLEKYNTPIIKKDNEIGEFVLDKRFNIFEGKVNWLGNSCNVFLKCVEELNNYEVCLDIFKEIYNDLNSYNKNALEFACDKLLDTANKWNEEHGREITREEFVSNLIIISCEVSKNGAYSISYSCGEILFGHIITVRGNIEVGLKDAFIEG